MFIRFSYAVLAFSSDVTGFSLAFLRFSKEIIGIPKNSSEILESPRIFLGSIGFS